jgi:hypothetical protein
MHLRCFVGLASVLDILAEPQDLPRVGESCILPVPDGPQRFRVEGLLRTYSFARALAGIDRLDLETVHLMLVPEAGGEPHAAQ